MRIISLQLMQDARPLYGDSFINVETTHQNWELTLVGDVIQERSVQRTEGLY